METKKENYFYVHNVGSLTSSDSERGMLKFSSKHGLSGLGLYSLTLEHLTANNGFAEVESIEDYFDNLFFGRTTRFSKNPYI